MKSKKKTSFNWDVITIDPTPVALVIRKSNWNVTKFKYVKYLSFKN